jgi:hypothetical protein
VIALGQPVELSHQLAAQRVELRLSGLVPLAGGGLAEAAQRSE